jgi:hypothetical protein
VSSQRVGGLSGGTGAGGGGGENSGSGDVSDGCGRLRNQALARRELVAAEN